MCVDDYITWCTSAYIRRVPTVECTFSRPFFHPVVTHWILSQGWVIVSRCIFEGHALDPVDAIWFLSLPGRDRPVRHLFWQFHKRCGSTLCWGFDLRVAGESATESSLIPLKGWRIFFIYTSFQIFYITLSLASSMSPAPMAMATTVRAPAKTRKRRSILVLLFHHGTWGEDKLFIQLLLDICHASKVWNYVTQEKGTITPNWDLRSTMMAKKSPSDFVSHNVAEGNGYVGWSADLSCSDTMRWWHSL